MSESEKKPVPKSRDEIRAVVMKVLADNFRTPESSMTEDVSIRRSLGLDSLEVVDFLFFLGEELGISTKLEEFRHVETLGDLVDELEKRLAAG